jgi:hypothetical protein
MLKNINATRSRLAFTRGESDVALDDGGKC